MDVKQLSYDLERRVVVKKMGTALQKGRRRYLIGDNGGESFKRGSETKTSITY